jgi:integrase
MCSDLTPALKALEKMLFAKLALAAGPAESVEITAPEPGQARQRIILPPDSWPVADRQVWDLALDGDGPLGADNPAVGWSPRTVDKVADGYGRYLAWLMRQDELVPGEAPVDRITPERVRAYVAELKASLSPVSVGIYIGALVAAANAFDPERDWRWLRVRYSRLKNRAEPSRDKHKAIRPTLELYRLGLRLMDEAPSTPTETRRAMKYTQGLMIALLAARPLRIRNFQDITIGRSLRYDGTTYWLTFSGVETKTGRAIDEPVPSSLVPYLETYLRVHRSHLLHRNGGERTAKHERRLWVDRDGNPMQEPAMRDTIKRVTRAAFGTAVWPHLFRDCLFTSLAVEQPELIGIGPALLGHSSLATGQKHYNQARMIEASRLYTAALLEVRTSFIRELLASQPGAPE